MSKASKLPGLCKTQWVERYTCFKVLLELFEALVTILDAIVSPWLLLVEVGIGIMKLRIKNKD